MDPLDLRRNRPAASNVELPYRESASQTAGPYVHIGCVPNLMDLEGVFPSDLCAQPAEINGQEIKISGQVFDGNGAISTDMMLEFWQADKDGNYKNGIWHRSMTDLVTGEYCVRTIKPGSYMDDEGRYFAPVLNLWIVARGINIGLHTKLYFPDEAAANSKDFILQHVDDDRRGTLLSVAVDKPNEYQFDISLQGENETVFFDV